MIPLLLSGISEGRDSNPPLAFYSTLGDKLERGVPWFLFSVFTRYYVRKRNPYFFLFSMRVTNKNEENIVYSQEESIGFYSFFPAVGGSSKKRRPYCFIFTTENPNWSLAEYPMCINNSKTSGFFCKPHPSPPVPTPHKY